MLKVSMKMKNKNIYNTTLVTWTLGVQVCK